LPKAALTEGHIGWWAKGERWTFPERDSTGKIIGMATRLRNGEKIVLKDSKRGLYFPSPWNKVDTRTIFLPEGSSDTLALHACGLRAVGRPSNRAGVGHLAELLKEIPLSTQILVVGEYDPNEKGQWPGRDGAVKVAGELSTKLGRTIGWTLPPNKNKDVRAWVNAQGLDVALADAWSDAGDNLEKLLLAGIQKTNDNQGQTPQEETPKLEKPEPKDPAFPNPVPITLLQADDESDIWLWDGFLAKNSFTLLTGLWKAAGKTTLLSALLRQMQFGKAFLNRPTFAGPIIIVTEEHKNHWINRRDRFGLTGVIHTVIRPFKTKPTSAEWIEFIAHLKKWAVEIGAIAIVLDPLANLWPVENENDAAEVQAALMPLSSLLEVAAILACHHPRKSDGNQATSSRGSGALPAFADILMELRRAQPDDSECRKRTITAYSRFDSTPPEMMIELDDDGTGYTCLGSKEAADVKAIQEMVCGIIPGQPPGMTANEILDNWPEGRKPNRTRFYRAVKLGINTLWYRTGAGKCHDPYCYLNKQAFDSVPPVPVCTNTVPEETQNNGCVCTSPLGGGTDIQTIDAPENKEKRRRPSGTDLVEVFPSPRDTKDAIPGR
jgi:hypothetical protein